MKKVVYLYLILIIVALLSSVVLAVHNWDPPPAPHRTLENINRMVSSLTRIRLGDPKDSDLNGPGASVDNHPTGIRFYQREWTRGNLGTVEFVHGKHSFVIDNALSFLGVAAQNVPEGIYRWKVNFGVSPEQADTHEAALARMMKLFTQLREKGWRRYIFTNHPRLTDKRAWDYLKKKSMYSLDSSYTPTIEEWKSVVKGRPHWYFYADGVYLHVSLMQSNMGRFVGKTTYLLTIEAMSEYAFYGLGYFPGDADKIHNWKALLPAQLRKYHADRLKTEAALQAQGETIDTAYQDPPIKALQESPGKPQ